MEETQTNFQRNETLDLESHLSGKTDVAVYRQLLADFKAQLARAKDITDTATAGVFKLDFGQLKGRVLPAISRCIEQLYQVLPRIAKKRMDAILKGNTMQNNANFYTNIVNFIVISSGLVNSGKEKQVVQCALQYS